MRKFYYVKFVVYITLAILLAFNAHFFVEYLKYTLAALMLLYGLETVIITPIKEKRKCLESYEFYVGFIEILVAFVLIFAINELSTLCVIWAMWSLLREASEIKKAILRFHEKLPAVIYTIESIVDIVLSIMLLMDPTEHHAVIHAYFLCVELVILGSINIVDYIVLYFREKKAKKVNQVEENSQEN